MLYSSSVSWWQSRHILYILRSLFFFPSFLFTYILSRSSLNFKAWCVIIISIFVLWSKILRSSLDQLRKDIESISPQIWLIYRVSATEIRSSFYVIIVYYYYYYYYYFIIIIIIIIIDNECFTVALADGILLESEWQQVSSGLSLEFEWQQISSSLLDSTQYSDWSQ